MTKLIFKPTHRVLIKATDTNHSYETVTIDVNNGTFYRKGSVKQNETKIRVNQGILAEKIGFENVALNKEEAQVLAEQFNAKRAELGFDAIEFHRLED